MSRGLGLPFREEIGMRAKPRRYEPTEGDAARHGGTVHYRIGRKPKVIEGGRSRRER